jgi:hypothetical protein
MENWKNSEKEAYIWFKENVDSNAEYYGGEDSTIGDIYSPKLEGYVEVKDITNGARCGQFTESTIKDNPYAQDIYNGNVSSEVCKNFIKYHYEKKGVTNFLVVDNDTISYHALEDFLSKYTFELQKPYRKRSGTGVAPKKDIPLLLENADFSIAEDGRVHCTNPERWGEYVSVIDPSDYYIGKKNGELRKRSNTINMTWHLTVKKS